MYIYSICKQTIFVIYRKKFLCIQNLKFYTYSQAGWKVRIIRKKTVFWQNSILLFPIMHRFNDLWIFWYHFCSRFANCCVCSMLRLRFLTCSPLRWLPIHPPSHIEVHNQVSINQIINKTTSFERSLYPLLIYSLLISPIRNLVNHLRMVALSGVVTLCSISLFGISSSVFHQK